MSDESFVFPTKLRSKPYITTNLKSFKSPGKARFAYHTVYVLSISRSLVGYGVNGEFELSCIRIVCKICRCSQ